jgi:hypothetical protein
LNSTDRKKENYMFNITDFRRVHLNDTHQVSAGTCDKDTVLIALKERLSPGRWEGCGQRVAFAAASAKSKRRYADHMRQLMIVAGAAVPMVAAITGGNARAAAMPNAGVATVASEAALLPKTQAGRFY